MLVVDDDEPLRSAMVELLESEGFQVETAANGREALDRLHETPPPSVIVLDLLMPVMDGWEFCELQARDPAIRAIPVLVVSATGEPSRPPRRVKNHDIFRKPADLPRLLSTIVGYCTAAP